MDRDLLKRRIIEYGKDLGFGIIRTTTSEPLELWKPQITILKEEDSKTAGLWAGMVYKPKKLMPEAKSIIVAAWPHRPYRANFSEGVGRFSAHYEEYPKGREAAKTLGEFLEKAGYKSMVHPKLPIKEIAHRSGIGYFGKNSLIHTEKYGSWISLHCILTSAKLSPDKGKNMISDCGNCNLCMRACPTGAIETEGRVTPSKCTRYYMLSADFIPVDIRDKIENKILGCDICQLVCPFNRESLTHRALPNADEMAIFDIGEILNLGLGGLKKKTEDMGAIIGKNYARPQRILSTAIIVAGNSNNKSYIPALELLLKHPHPPIRGHSAWAIGKIGLNGGLNNCRRILREALKHEAHHKVIEEIHRAMGILDENHK